MSAWHAGEVAARLAAPCRLRRLRRAVELAAAAEGGDGAASEAAVALPDVALARRKVRRRERQATRRAVQPTAQRLGELPRAYRNSRRDALDADKARRAAKKQRESSP